MIDESSGSMFRVMTESTKLNYSSKKKRKKKACVYVKRELWEELALKG